MTTTTGAQGIISSQLSWHTSNALTLVNKGLTELTSLNTQYAGRVDYDTVGVKKLDDKPKVADYDIEKVDYDKLSLDKDLPKATTEVPIKDIDVDTSISGSPVTERDDGKLTIPTLLELNEPKFPTLSAEIAPTPVTTDFKNLDTLLTLPSINEVTLDAITVPDLSVATPNLNVNLDAFTPPSIPASFTWNEQQYTSSELDEIDSIVQSLLKNNVGISDTDWHHIWQKEQDKENLQAARHVKEIRQSFANLGFTLPSGPQAALELEAAQDVLDASTERSRTLAIERAKMEIENVRHAIGVGIQIETLKNTIHESTTNRLYETAKYTADFLLRAHESYINAFNTKVTAFKAEIELFNAEVQKAKLQIEEYITTLQGKDLQIRINDQTLKQLESEISVLRATIDHNNSLISKSDALLNIEKTKIEAYNTDVQAYKALVDANTDKYTRYESALRAQSQYTIDKYRNELDAYKIENDVLSDITGSKLAIDQGLVSRAEFDLQNIKTKLDVNNVHLSQHKMEADIAASNVKVKLDAFLAQDESANKYNNILLSKYQTDLQGLQIDVTRQQTNYDRELAATKIEADNALGLTKSYAELSAKAGAHMMSVLNIGSNIQDSVSHNYQYEQA